MIIVVSGVTGSGVETFSRLLADALRIPAYRGDDMGHWDVDEVYDRWVYADDDLDLNKLFLAECAGIKGPGSALTSEITAVISLTDGADQNVMGRLLSINQAIPVVAIRYYVDSPLTLVRRVRKWRASHDLPDIASSSDTELDLCVKMGCVVDAAFPRLEDGRVAHDESAWSLVPCSKTFAELERVLGAIIGCNDKKWPLVERRGSYCGDPLLSSSSRTSALHLWSALHTLSSAGIKLDALEGTGDVATTLACSARSLVDRAAGEGVSIGSSCVALSYIRDFVHAALARGLRLRPLPSCMNGLKNRGYGHG